MQNPTLAYRSIPNGIRWTASRRARGGRKYGYCCRCNSKHARLPRLNNRLQPASHQGCTAQSFLDSIALFWTRRCCEAFGTSPCRGVCYTNGRTIQDCRPDYSVCSHPCGSLPQGRLGLEGKRQPPTYERKRFGVSPCSTSLRYNIRLLYYSLAPKCAPRLCGYISLLWASITSEPYRWKKLRKFPHTLLRVSILHS